MEGWYWDAPVTEHKKTTIFFISNTRFAYRMTENCYLMLLLPIKIFNSLKRKLHSTQSEAFQNSFLRECVAFSNFQNKILRGQIFLTIFKKTNLIIIFVLFWDNILFILYLGSRQCYFLMQICIRNDSKTYDFFFTNNWTKWHLKLWKKWVI